MTRDQYIVARNAGSIEPLYEYYKEHRNEEKPLIPLADFTEAMRVYPDAPSAMEKAWSHYDNKFTVMTVQDISSGRVLKYY